MIKNIKLKNSVIAYDPGELIDKLTILQIKEIKLPKSKANFNEGIKKIIKDKMIVVLGVKFGKIFQILILHIIQHMVGSLHQKI